MQQGSDSGNPSAPQGVRRKATSAATVHQFRASLDEIKPAIASHLAQPGARCSYLYDFGDGWSHSVVLEDILPREKGTKYPRCIDGARACPPEDCGGVSGYLECCEALFDPNSTDPDVQDLLDWLDDFEPEAFHANKVRFHSAVRRLKTMLSEG